MADRGKWNKEKQEGWWDIGEKQTLLKSNTFNSTDSGNKEKQMLYFIQDQLPRSTHNSVEMTLRNQAALKERSQAPIPEQSQHAPCMRKASHI